MWRNKFKIVTAIYGAPRWLAHSVDRLISDILNLKKPPIRSINLFDLNQNTIKETLEKSLRPFTFNISTSSLPEFKYSLAADDR